MVFAGILVAVLGFAISVLGLGMGSTVQGRLVFALAGNAVTLAAIIGIINRAYLRNAIWRK